MTATTKTITRRSSVRTVDAYRQGSVIAADGEWLVIVGYTRRQDDHGGYVHILTVRPATTDEAKVGRIEQLQAKLSAMVAGPDDERSRARHDAEVARLDNEIRGLEGRPTREAEAEAKRNDHLAQFAAAWAGNVYDRIGWITTIANRPGSPLRGNASYGNIAERAGIPSSRLKEIGDEDKPEITEAEIAAIAAAVGLDAAALRDGTGGPPTIS